MFCSKCGNQIDDEAMICPKCGCATKNMTNGNYTASPEKSDIIVQKNGTASVNKGNNKKIFVVIGIVVSIVLILALPIFAKIQSDNIFESYSTANTNAKIVYTNTCTYMVECGLNDVSLKDEVYKVNLCNESSYYSENGTDVERFLQNKMGVSNKNGGYALVKIKDSGYTIEEAYWCKKDCFGSDYENFDLSKVNSKKYVVGSYPDANYPEYD